MLFQVLGRNETSAGGAILLRRDEGPRGVLSACLLHLRTRLRAVRHLVGWILLLLLFFFFFYNFSSKTIYQKCELKLMLIYFSKILKFETIVSS